MRTKIHSNTIGNEGGLSRLDRMEQAILEIYAWFEDGVKAHNASLED